MLQDRREEERLSADISGGSWSGGGSETEEEVQRWGRHRPPRSSTSQRSRRSRGATNMSMIKQ